MNRLALSLLLVLFPFLITPAYAIDLKSEEDTPTETAPASNDATEVHKQWYDRFTLSGFAAGGYVKTGKNGNQSQGHFNASEASLFVDAKAWEHVHFYLDWEVIRLGQEDTLPMGQIGELYIHFVNILSAVKDDLLGVKIGRFDIPFGEDYLTQYAIYNPLITLSAGWPYGWDEGVELYGKLGGLGWIFSVTDGYYDHHSDDSGAKAENFKFYGEPLRDLYLSASFMHNGYTTESAELLGGTRAQPVGSLGGGTSVSPASPSPTVDANLYELDARYTFLRRLNILLGFGQMYLNDNAPGFSRKISYYEVQPQFYITDQLYAVARVSGIGTYDNKKGFHFPGFPFTGSPTQFKDDVKSLTRASIGLGYILYPRTVLKAEYSNDSYELIDGSAFNSDQSRNFFGLQVAIGF